MDYLDRLIELAWNASPVDRLRLERTIMLVMQAREIVLQTRRIEQQAWERLAQAKTTLQQCPEDGRGRFGELQIMRDSSRE
jgi:hypothetical protein